jgi:hypothetical protein
VEKKYRTGEHKCKGVIVDCPTGSYFYDPIEFGWLGTIARMEKMRSDKDWVLFSLMFPFGILDTVTLGLYGLTIGPLLDALIPFPETDPEVISEYEEADAKIKSKKSAKKECSIKREISYLKQSSHREYIEDSSRVYDPSQGNYLVYIEGSQFPIPTTFRDGIGTFQIPKGRKYPNQITSIKRTDGEQLISTEIPIDWDSKEKELPIDDLTPSQNPRQQTNRIALFSIETQSKEIMSLSTRLKNEILTVLAPLTPKHILITHDNFSFYLPQNMTLEKCTDECPLELAKMFDADWAIFGGLKKSGEKYILTLKAYQIQDYQPRLVKVIEEQNPRELRKELNDVAQNIRELIQEDK